MPSTGAEEDRSLLQTRTAGGCHRAHNTVDDKSAATEVRHRVVYDSLIEHHCVGHRRSAQAGSNDVISWLPSRFFLSVQFETGIPAQHLLLNLISFLNDVMARA